MSGRKLPGITFRLDVRVSRGLPANAAGKRSAARTARTRRWPYLSSSFPAGKQGACGKAHMQVIHTGHTKQASRQLGKETDQTR